MGELRVAWGGSDRKAGTTSVHKSVVRPGPVWVVIVKRERVDEWRAMWYFGTGELAEEHRPRAIGLDGNGGRVLEAEIAEGRAYLVDRSVAAATQKKHRQAQMCPRGCGYPLALKGLCGNCDDQP